MRILKSVLVLAGLLTVVAVSAQDKIYRRSGDVVTAKIVEVSEEFVVYKSFTNPEGPNYRIRKDAIDKVVYQNGTVENFGGTAYTPKPSNSAMYIDPASLGKNIINFDFLSILFNEVGFSYERVINNGFIGVKVPLIMGVGAVTDNQVREFANKYQSGLDLNLYPTGQGSVKYFIGPALRFGQVTNNNFNSYYDPLTNTYTSYNQNETFNLLAFQVNNGVMFQPTTHFNVSLVLGIGLRKLTPTSGNGSTEAENYGTFSANIAYRF